VALQALALNPSLNILGGKKLQEQIVITGLYETIISITEQIFWEKYDTMLLAVNL